MFDKFLSSAIRQVGRDLGKVVSNHAFGDAHATPIRHVNRIANISGPIVGSKSSDARRKTDFEKSVNFRMTYTPKTLINKLAGAFVELKNESKTLTDDGYLSISETKYFLGILQDFSEKSANVVELLEMNPKTSQEDMDYLSKITYDLTAHVVEVAQCGCDGATEEIKAINDQLSNIDTFKAANINLLWAAILVISIIVGYYIWESWLIIPILISGILFWQSFNSLSEKKALISRLEARMKNEAAVMSILGGMIESETFRLR